MSAHQEPQRPWILNPACPSHAPERDPRLLPATARARTTGRGSAGTQDLGPWVHILVNVSQFHAALRTLLERA